MISDGELMQMIREGEELGYSTIVEALAELQAYRKAFSEPTAWVYRIDIELGSDQILCRSRESTACKMPLYRKPTIPGQEI